MAKHKVNKHADQSRPSAVHDGYALAVKEIIEQLVSSADSRSSASLTKIRNEISAKYHLSTVAKVSDLIAAIPDDYKSVLLPLLRMKPVRTASGIAVVAVMCKHHRCPHIATTGNVCVYCPGGPDSDFEYSTQAYMGTNQQVCVQFVLDTTHILNPKVESSN